MPVSHAELVQGIRDPSPTRAAALLSELSLANPPSREKIHEEIQERLLLPSEQLPTHWLPTYQVYGDL